MNPVTASPDALARFRAAASAFAQRAKSRDSRLEAIRDDIAALRAKGASYRTISELLTRCGIRASDTCVIHFCRTRLGEAPTRGNSANLRTSSRKKRVATAPGSPNANGAGLPVTIPNESAQIALLEDLLSYQPEPSAKPCSQSGPRIAKIEFANPEKS
jgi:hypothetical protein